MNIEQKALKKQQIIEILEVTAGRHRAVQLAEQILALDDWIPVDERLPDKKVLATYKNSHGKNRIIVAEYFPRFTVESSCEFDEYDEYCEEKDAYFYREGWYEQQDNWGEYASIFVHEGDVTHWKPLPEPPTKEEGDYYDLTYDDWGGDTCK